MSNPDHDIHEQYFGSRHVTVIEPPRGFRSLDFAELWAYRELLVVLTMRDIKVRYKQTVLGFAWAVIQPVMMMQVLMLIYGTPWTPNLLMVPLLALAVIVTALGMGTLITALTVAYR